MSQTPSCLLEAVGLAAAANFKILKLTVPHVDQTASAAKSPATEEQPGAVAADRTRSPWVLAVAVVAVVLISLLDHVTGTELRIYPLYVVPIAVVSWKSGWPTGTLLSALAMVAWAGSNRLAGLEFPARIWVANSAAHLVAFLTVVVLVEHLQRSRAAERRMAREDSLTGLPNTRAFNELSRAEIARQHRHGLPLTVAFLDLDNFKQVNDRFGHQEGDRLLAVVGRTLRQSVRGTDHVGRLGGDEFAILMPETDEAGAMKVLDRIRTALLTAMTAHGWPVSTSIGAVTFCKPPGHTDDLLGLADAMMYRVKESGKDAIRVGRWPAVEPEPGNG